MKYSQVMPENDAITNKPLPPPKEQKSTKVEYVTLKFRISGLKSFPVKLKQFILLEKKNK